MLAFSRIARFVPSARRENQRCIGTPLVFAYDINNAACICVLNYRTKPFAVQFFKEHVWVHGAPGVGPRWYLH